MIIKVKVITKAKKESIQRISKDSLKIKINILPKKGKANKKLIQLLAEYFDVSKKNVRIIKGQKSHDKVIEILSSKGSV